MHQFVKSYVVSEGGKVDDVCKEYFTVDFPRSLAPQKYTYQPLIAKEQGIELIATGTPVLDSIIRDCLEKGAISRVALQLPKSPESVVASYFKESDFFCERCDKITLKDGGSYVCTSEQPCFHKINNSKIRTIDIVSQKPIFLFQFYFSVLFKNKLRKNEEQIVILVDDNNQIREANILEASNYTFEDADFALPAPVFDRAKAIADEHLDFILKNKQLVFDLMLNSQVTRRLTNLEKRLHEEQLENSITNKNNGFNEKDWLKKKNQVLNQEAESLQTTVSVKFTNLLAVKTLKIDFKVILENNSELMSSIIMGLDKQVQIFCPECGKLFNEGYATEDGAYLCKDCINQSVESCRVYSKHYPLQTDSILHEHLDRDEGFTCPICGKLNLNLVGVKCNWSQKTVCINCSTKCDSCGELFSTPNIYKSSKTGKSFCAHHNVRCDNCGSNLGIDEFNLCKATGKKFCSCMKFFLCSSCEQGYSGSALSNGKCPACNTLSEKEHDLQNITAVLKVDPSKSKIKRWLVGRNALNTIIVAKGFLNDNLYVVEERSVVYQKNLSFISKLRGK